MKVSEKRCKMDKNKFSFWKIFQIFLIKNSCLSSIVHDFKQIFIDDFRWIGGFSLFEIFGNVYRILFVVFSLLQIKRMVGQF
jgi:hypothetical protein